MSSILVASDRCFLAQRCVDLLKSLHSSLLKESRSVQTVTDTSNIIFARRHVFSFYTMLSKQGGNRLVAVLEALPFVEKSSTIEHWIGHEEDED